MLDAFIPFAVYFINFLYRLTELYLINPWKPEISLEKSDITNHSLAHVSERSENSQHVKKFWPIVDILNFYMKS